MKKKSIMKNSIYNMFYKGFTALFPLITTTYISRVLLADGIGKVNYANTIVTYFVLIASLGIPFYGVKVIAQNSKEKIKLNTAFFELFIINFVSTTVCIFIYFILVNNFSYFNSKVSLLNVFGIMLLLNYFNLDWFYQGIEEYSYIATRSIILKIVSFILMLIFVKDTSDYLIYAIILCIATAGNYLLNAVNLKKYISKEHEQIHIGVHLKPIFIFLASVIAQELYSTLDTIMLEHFYGDACVGYYTNSIKIIKMVYTLSIAMVAVFYPRISQYIKENKQEDLNKLIALGVKIILIISVPGVIGIILTAKYSIMTFFGQTFLEAVSTIKILSVLIIVLSIAYFLGHVVLMSAGKEKNILGATFLGVIINLILNYLLIPIYKQNGAAIASVTSEIIVMIILIYNAKKYYTLKINKSFFKSLFFSVLLMTVYLIIINIFIDQYILGMIIATIGGVLFYGLGMIITKNEMVVYFLNIIKKRNIEQ